jgi:hypothetical protein
MPPDPGGATAICTDDPRATLEALAGALPREHFSAALTASPGPPPCLAVVYRDAPSHGVDIYVEDGWYWWAWGERIEPVHLLDAVAAALAQALRPLTRS